MLLYKIILLYKIGSIIKCFQLFLSFSMDIVLKLYYAFVQIHKYFLATEYSVLYELAIFITFLLSVI